MSIYIYSGVERVGMLQNESSVQWVENYRSYGEAKIVCGATPENVANLAVGNRLHNTRTGTVADIVSTEVTEWLGHGELAVRALGSAAMLGQRVVMGTEVITNVEEGMRRCYTNNRRGLPPELAPARGFAETAHTEFAWDSVLKAFTTLCEESGLGFRVTFDPDANTETLDIYKGANRTAGEPYNGYFGAELGNLLNLNLAINHRDYRNVAIVAGEGEGTAQVVVTATLGDVPPGGRRELYVNASGVKSTFRAATGLLNEKGEPAFTEKTYTPEEYRQVLAQKGMEALLKNIATISISAEVTQNPMAYGKDYFLGDIVPVRCAAYNLTVQTRVLAITWVYEPTGEKLLLKLGDFKTTEEDEQTWQN